MTLPRSYTRRQLPDLGAGAGAGMGKRDSYKCLFSLSVWKG